MPQLENDNQLEALKLEQEKNNYAATVKKLKAITGMSDEEFHNMEIQFKEQYKKEAQANFGIAEIELERAISLVLSEFKEEEETRDGVTTITRNQPETTSKLIAICKEYNTKKINELDDLPF